MAINYSNLKKVVENLNEYRNIELMIVTKKRPQEEIIELIEKGYCLFGENRIQEIDLKILPLRSKYNFELHLIGPLQTNKTKQALKLVDAIQSLDRIKLVDEILKHLDSHSLTNKFYIQINIGREQQKSGVMPENVSQFYNYCKKKGLPIKGFMCIPPNIKNPSKFFAEMIDIRDSIDENLKLSMGMSSDYIHALKNQTNQIRIGSFLFE